MINGFAHQTAALEQFKDQPAFALFWEMGTGKTKVALDIASYRLRTGVIDKVLVVTPLAVVNHWCTEIAKFTPDMDYITTTGTSSSKVASLSKPAKVYITNYDTLTYTSDEVIDFVNHRTLVIFDESTKVKRPKAKRSKTARALSDKTAHVALLTGTPITNSLFDVWGQMYLMDKGVTLGDNFWQFRRLYFKSVDYNGWIWVPLPGTQDAVKKAMAKYGTFLRKEDCLDLPPKVYVTIDIPMNDYTKKLYDDFARDLILKFGDQEVKGATVLAELIKLHEIANGFVISSTGNIIDIANSKIEYLCDMLEDELYGQQAIIWCPYRALLRRLFDEVSKRVPQLVVQTLYGDTPKLVRKSIERDVQSGKIRILIANQDVGGFGINLTPSPTAIYFTNNYKVETRMQSEDRIHRPGMTADKAVIVDLIVPKTVDQSIYRLLMKKIDVSKSMVTIKAIMEGNV